MNRLLLILTGALLVVSAIGSVTSAQEAEYTWSPEDITSSKTITEAKFSDEGTMVAWIKRRPAEKNDKFVTDLYLTRLTVREENGDYKTVQLTRSDDSDKNPVFSADGETIYFLSSKESGKVLWAMSIWGGEPYKVDSFNVSISNMTRYNKNYLAFEAEEGESLYEQELKKKKDDVVVVEDTAHFKTSRLFGYDLLEKERTRLTTNDFPIMDYAISDDGKWAVTSHMMSPHFPADADPKPTYYLWDLANTTNRQILKSGYQSARDFDFTKSSAGFYFVGDRSSDPEWSGAGISLLYFFDLGKQDADQVPLQHDWGLGRGYTVQGENAVASLANGTTNKVAIYAKGKDSWQKTPVNVGSYTDHIDVIDISENGTKWLYSYSTASLPTQYRVSDLMSGKNESTLTEGKIVTEINKHLDDNYMARTEVISWTGALNEKVEGILFYPKDYEKGRRYPLVVGIHGGPSSVDTDSWRERWSYYPHLMTEKGVFYLKPNYHGSSNYGQKFVESIKGHYYEYELVDIVNGINHLDGKGMIDQDSMAVLGWSNGAILSTMLTVKYPDLFKVAAAGAGDVNWTSDFGTCRFGVTFDQSYFGGAPWDNTGGNVFNENYIIKSPLFEMEKVKTPTIIFHGSEDRAVPRDQGWEYYRALQQVGQAPVRFLWFPGQPHGLQKITHQERKMKEEIAWIDQYLFGKAPKKQDEVFKEVSPIAALLKKEKTSMVAGQLGVNLGGSLVPEVVLLKEDSIAIGRYEVTNAQYKAYDQNFRFDAGKDNFPVVGVTLEQATNYVKWLSQKSGDTYRLPTSEEAKAIHKKAKEIASKENTLNYWAGYEMTVDEVSLFRARISSLEASLIKEAGSFAPAEIKSAEIYDLGGNVAEYDADGNLYGFSAYDFVDETAVSPDRKYTVQGFRVVRE